MPVTADHKGDEEQTDARHGGKRCPALVPGSGGQENASPPRFRGENAVVIDDLGHVRRIDDLNHRPRRAHRPEYEEMPALGIFEKQ